ncbi:hypothetical protein THAOC_10414 [Thalassiosira oceanica]|uniref:Uncharacterized protein n=1 Tax=Thalassiosira oceanica TaxID=159749 RepID=K0STU3_THAOC|nr:hypothetical protein THAOC_10414 [Thalassiosira oceanica]|eukprot:EJK68409.1 hypothetical protein THAOC_10414 [Thalassiosira oceanica]
MKLELLAADGKQAQEWEDGSEVQREDCRLDCDADAWIMAVPMADTGKDWGFDNQKPSVPPATVTIARTFNIRTDVDLDWTVGDRPGRSSKTGSAGRTTGRRRDRWGFGKRAWRGARLAQSPLGRDSEERLSKTRPKPLTRPTGDRLQVSVNIYGQGWGQVIIASVGQSTVYGHGLGGGRGLGARSTVSC